LKTSGFGSGSGVTSWTSDFLNGENTEPVEASFVFEPFHHGRGGAPRFARFVGAGYSAQSSSASCPI
jgi:hypothetical protein